MHASPPLCAHAGHGSGSPFKPSPTANAPMTAPKPAMEASCAASSSAVDGIALGTEDAPRRPVGTHVVGVDARARRRRRRGGTRGPARHRGHHRYRRASERGDTSRLNRARAGMALAASTSRSRTRAIFTRRAPLGSPSASTSSGCGKRDTRRCPSASLLSASQRETRSGGESRSTARDRVLTGCPPSTSTAPWRARPRLAETSVAVGTSLRAHASPRRGRDGLLAPRGNGRPATRRAREQTRPRPSHSARRVSSRRPAAASPAGAWRAAPRPASGSARRRI